MINDASPPAPPSGQSFSFLQLVLLALGVMATALCFANIPRALRFIDNLLDRSPDATDQESADQDARWSPDTSADALSSFGTGMSAPEIRSQTEILRALKEQLDAQVQAVNATIREERARADGQP